MAKTSLLVSLGEWTNRTLILPVVVFFPTSRCNSRCVSCDWWQADGAGDLDPDEIDRLAGQLPALGTRVVLFSGGEPLLRPEIFDLAPLFTRRGLALHLHTSGVLLERSAPRVATQFSKVIVSLDSADEDGYRSIRGVNALRAVERGILKLRDLAPLLPMSARATLHRRNFRELPRIVEHARAMALDGVSFLAADVTSGAFGRAGHGPSPDLALDRDEIVEFADIVERTIVERRDDFESGFIAESPARLRRLPQYYAALAGLAPFPDVRCNAPYVSVVIEADGQVRPCFFHRAVGSIRSQPLARIVEHNLVAFRESLSVGDDPVCERCVCSMRAGWRSAPWR
ncbi:MAG: radical SAM protein [Vicinamibacterales bacterium]